jgi:hypothetical protein
MRSDRAPKHASIFLIMQYFCYIRKIILSLFVTRQGIGFVTTGNSNLLAKIHTIQNTTHTTYLLSLFRCLVEASKVGGCSASVVTAKHRQRLLTQK